MRRIFLSMAVLLAAVLLAAVLLAGVGWAAGGVVVLKDGTKLEGKIQPTRDGFVITDSSGKATVVAAGDVVSMQPDRATQDRATQDRATQDRATPGAGARTAGEAGNADIVALRRSVATLRDAKQAVEKYQAFLARNPSAAARAEAEKELAVWQDRADRGLVRVGDDWVTAVEAGEKQQKAASVAGDAAAMVAAGNYVGAETAVDGALRDAPANPALLYLKGVALFHLNKLVPARNAFEKVEASQPNNWAVHNNLAVILWQTRAQMPALAQYEKAMGADPGNQKVLDNVAEALHQMPPTSMKNEVVRKVVARFTEQDAALAARMKHEKGLMRVGAQWVPADEYAAIQAVRKDAEEKVAQYRKEAADLPGELNAMDQDLTIKTNAMKAMTQESLVVDIYGRMVYQPLPEHYYQLKQEVERMTAERVLKQRRLDQLLRLMNEAQKQLSAAQDRYTGKQSIVEESGMPGAVAATQPG